MQRYLQNKQLVFWSSLLLSKFSATVKVRKFFMKDLRNVAGLLQLNYLSFIERHT